MNILFFAKLLISLCIIALCAHIGRKYPSLGGLIATMPLTGLVVLLWLYSDNPGNYDLMVRYTKAALWGILPSILFFLVAYLCFNKQLPLYLTLLASSGAWLAGALFHQWFLR